MILPAAISLIQVSNSKTFLFTKFQNRSKIIFSFYFRGSRNFYNYIYSDRFSSAQSESDSALLQFFNFCTNSFNYFSIFFEVWSFDSLYRVNWFCGW